MTISQQVGPLAGKTTFAVAGWLIVWLQLHLHLRRREVAFRAWSTAALALVGAGLLGTFPPFFQLFTNAH